MEIELLVQAENKDSTEKFVLPLQHRQTLGRGPESPIPFEGTALSRDHFRLHLEDGIVFVTDLSNNGTWINGRRLQKQQKAELENGDTIEVPGYKIAFQAPQLSAVTSSQDTHNKITETVSMSSSLESISGKGSRTATGSLLAPLSAFLGSFTKLERFLILHAVVSFALLISYLMS